LDKWLGGPQNQSGHTGEEENSQSLVGVGLLISQPVAPHYTNEASWLPLIIMEGVKNSLAHILSAMDCNIAVCLLLAYWPIVVLHHQSTLLFQDNL